ncbi:MAG: ABC transporter substrate-binding protein [Cyanobacteria bacterium SW_9_44_58]|nr:MAG: ABC transporter substrate-binding protein [Cyanobacteria bacterium SW_9_44_58]
MVELNSVSWRSRVLSLGYGLILSSVCSFLPATVQAATLPEIKAQGKLTVAVKEQLRPMGFRNAQGKLQGFEIDLARRLAQEILGDANAIKLEPVANRERFKAVLNGDVDIAIAHVSQTPARSRLVVFSPYYYLARTAFVSKDEDIKQLQDIRSGKIAVLNESSTIAEVRFRLPQAQLVGVDSYQQALSLLEAGKAAAFAGDETVLTGWVQQYSQYHLLSQRIGGEALAVVMPKGLQYTALHQKVNQTIRQLRESGWLQQKAKEWGLTWETGPSE